METTIISTNDQLSPVAHISVSATQNSRPASAPKLDQQTKQQTTDIAEPGVKRRTTAPKRQKLDTNGSKKPDGEFSDSDIEISDDDDDEGKDSKKLAVAPASLAATRSRRSNYGSRLALHVAREREAICDPKVINCDESDDDFDPGGDETDGKQQKPSSKKSKPAGDLRQLLHVDAQDGEDDDDDDDDDYVGDDGGDGEEESNGDDDENSSSSSSDNENVTGNDANSNSDAEKSVADGRESGNSIQILEQKSSLKSTTISGCAKLSLKVALVDADDVVGKTQQFVQKLFEHRNSVSNSVGGGEEMSCCCAVCFHDYCDEDNDLVACDRCGLTVHETCYGISDPATSPRASPSVMMTSSADKHASLLQSESFELKQPVIDKAVVAGGDGDDDDDAMSVQSNYSTVPWFCDPCLAGVADMMHCVACAATEGAFKETDTGKWIHMICATQMRCHYHDESNYRFANVDRCSSAAALGGGGSTGGPAGAAVVATRPCFACRDNFEANMGQTFQCQSGLCTRYLHATCAFRLGCAVDEYATNVATGTGNAATTTLHVAQIVYCPEHVGRETRRARQQDYIVCMARAQYRKERMLAARERRRGEEKARFDDAEIGGLAFWNEDGMSDELRARNGRFFSDASRRYAVERDEAFKSNAAHRKTTTTETVGGASPMPMPYQACGEFIRAMHARALHLGYNPRPVMDPSADTLGAYKFDRSGGSSFSAEFVAHVRQRELKLQALDGAIEQTALKASELCETQQKLFERRKKIELECRRIGNHGRGDVAEIDADGGGAEEDEDDERRKQRQLQLAGECRTMHEQARTAANDIRRVMQLLAKLSTKHMTAEQREAVERAHREMLGGKAAPITGSLFVASVDEDVNDETAANSRAIEPMVARNVASNGARRRGRPRERSEDVQSLELTSGGVAAAAEQKVGVTSAMLDGMAICVHCSRLGHVKRDLVKCAKCQVCYHKSCLSGEGIEMAKGGSSGWKGFQFICKECDETETEDGDDDNEVEEGEKAEKLQKLPIATTTKQEGKPLAPVEALGVGKRKRVAKKIAAAPSNAWANGNSSVMTTATAKPATTIPITVVKSSNFRTTLLQQGSSSAKSSTSSLAEAFFPTHSSAGGGKAVLQSGNGAVRAASMAFFPPPVAHQQQQTAATGGSIKLVISKASSPEAFLRRRVEPGCLVLPPPSCSTATPTSSSTSMVQQQQPIQPLRVVLSATLANGGSAVAGRGRGGGGSRGQRGGGRKV